MMNNQSFKRTFTGKVTSNKADKTLTVLVNRRVKHSLYGKIVTRSKKYHVHDENNQGNIGDVVLIEETRPISKTKTWRLVRVNIVA